MHAVAAALGIPDRRVALTGMPGTLSDGSMEVEFGVQLPADTVESFPDEVLRKKIVWGLRSKGMKVVGWGDGDGLHSSVPDDD